MCWIPNLTTASEGNWLGSLYFIYWFANQQKKLYNNDLHQSIVLQLWNRMHAMQKLTLGFWVLSTGQDIWRMKTKSTIIHRPHAKSSVKVSNTTEFKPHINASVGTNCLGNWRRCQRKNAMMFVQEMLHKNVVEGKNEPLRSITTYNSSSHSR